MQAQYQWKDAAQLLFSMEKLLKWHFGGVGGVGGVGGEETWLGGREKGEETREVKFAEDAREGWGWLRFARIGNLAISSSPTKNGAY
ncbi:hypothetical protein NPX13_g10042 [Xylaria arbuscula]|uniref:Uncharacterized protein n=1 Tax=Xylaria arbuscula TaxID=114810 RepID=A0A9W8N5I8_9PEZI|nr:hypothetical protein NPX13_g10042 [Xylaria arbuscula]